MQRLTYVLFQLDEARRYIEDGRLERLRLALLLLDNAAEIQMDQRIRKELAHEELMQRVRQRVLQIPEAARSDDLRAIARQLPLSVKERTRLERYFNEKVDCLTTRWHHLDARLAEPLKYLHRYRNEAYHRARVRRETIRTAALMLLEINCHLLLSLRGGVSSYASNEDYSWIKERFGVDAMRTFMDAEVLRSVADDLRSSVLPTDESVSTALADHLEDRIAELYASLDFLVENTSVITSREEALKYAQHFAAVEGGTIDPSLGPLDGFEGVATLSTVEEVKTRVPAVRRASSRLETFRQFASAECDLDPIESCVNALASQVDAMIQLEVDRLRGK